ncbi:MAG TPA: D-aminoacyl-tRNA deacylase [Actinomycetospora sp.]|uniref:D-aminoacyl-tRNA deacylase n=1 Tax=Actinomycetospora sp. TaxID=1872135 RepID=UPI002F42104C
MRAVVARVTRASVVVAGDAAERSSTIGTGDAAERSSTIGTGQTVGALDGPGLLVLLGVHRDDPARVGTADDPVPVMARKLHELRILGPGERSDGEWARERSCAETGAGLLVVSQFTLYGETRTGRRPSWSAAAPGPDAERLVTGVVEALRGRGAPVARGVFGAEMAVESVNDGPFTVLVEV